MLNKAYWPLYGQMKIIDEINEYDICADKFCPEKIGIYFSYIFLIVYMIAANILLINLLIAMFR